jgi:uncharacterized protein GlcG (DUF336 family)
MQKFEASEFFKTENSSFNKYFQTALLTEAPSELIALEMNCSGSFCYSISNEHGNIVAKISENFTPPRSIILADQKAKTTALFGVPSENVCEKRLHSLRDSTNLCGGYPIFSPDGNLVGGFGVSGGTEQEDQFAVRYLLHQLNCYQSHKFNEELMYSELVVHFGASKEYTRNK